MEDFEYIRQGMYLVWMFVEPLAGWRAALVTIRKTVWTGRSKRAKCLKHRAMYAQPERITLVCDNLSAHRLPSLYKAFTPEEALRLTLVHGRWLNMAEPELSVLTRQCQDQRISLLARANQLA
jgi:hypothetical protein